MVDQLTADNPDEAEAKGRERSTIRFPYYDLDAAVDLVRTIHNTRGQRTSLDDLVGVLPNFSTSRSGAFRQLISAAVLFGLLEAAGREVSLTNRAYQVLGEDDDARRQGRAEAFLAVPLFQAIFTQYRGRTLPPQIGMLRTIEQLGVVNTLSDRAYGTMMRSAEQAGFFEVGGRQYLVQPTFRRGSAAAPVETEAAEQADVVVTPETAHLRITGGGGTPPPSGIHPAIMGLLQLLPPDGRAFPAAARKTWLSAIGGALDLIYGSGGMHGTPDDEEVTQG